MTNCVSSGNAGAGFGANYSGVNQGGDNSEYLGCSVVSIHASGIVLGRYCLAQDCSIVSNGIDTQNSAGVLLPGNNYYSVSGRCNGNSIIGNRNGILIPNGAAGNSFVISSNRISGNIDYKLSNLSSTEITAANNFGGEPTTSELATNVRNLTKIYDKRDDPALGLLVMYPYPANAPTSKGLILPQQPQHKTFWESETATFTAAASSPNPITYQWRKVQSALAGKTNSSLVIDNAQLNDAATNYNVSVTDAA